MNDTQKLAVRLRVRRELRGLTQQEVADATGVAKDILCGMETYYTYATVECVVRIAKFLQMPLDDLFQGLYEGN